MIATAVLPGYRAFGRVSVAQPNGRAHHKRSFAAVRACVCVCVCIALHVLPVPDAALRLVRRAFCVRTVAGAGAVGV